VLCPVCYFVVCSLVSCFMVCRLVYWYSSFELYTFLARLSFVFIMNFVFVQFVLFLYSAFVCCFQNHGVYMFRLSDNLVVDATMAGGPARYINHSCHPNCVAEVVPLEKDSKIIIITKRKIAQGEEVFMTTFIRQKNVRQY